MSGRTGLRMVKERFFCQQIQRADHVCRRIGGASKDKGKQYTCFRKCTSDTGGEITRYTFKEAAVKTPALCLTEGKTQSRYLGGKRDSTKGATKECEEAGKAERGNVSRGGESMPGTKKKKGGWSPRSLVVR